jgi:flagellin-like protein
MMKKMWKNRSGVSPVIATILMVAITVVLAAVLYVMVMGFGGNPSSTPTGQFKAAEKLSDGKYKIQVLSISEAKDVADMRFSVATSAGTDVYVVKGGDLAAPSEKNVDAVTKIVFTDLNGDGKVSTGDYFTLNITAGASDATYTAALSYSPASGTGGSICDTSFIVPKAT